MAVRGAGRAAPRPGSYFTRELPGAGLDRRGPWVSTAPSTHSTTCAAHRGNKVVWQEHPQEESNGSCREFSCKYHGWRYGLDGRGHARHQRGGVLRPRPEHASACRKVHCDVFAGFIFVNLVDGSGAVARLPRRAHPRARGVPVREDDAALRVLHPDQRELEARHRLRCASGTTRRTSTAASSTRTSPRPRRWCRRSTRTTTTSSRPTC